MECNELVKTIRGIASKLLETDRDERICTLLLDLRTIVESEVASSTKSTVLFEIWSQKLPQKIVQFLVEKQDYLSTTWLYACYLCSISVHCCIGYIDVEQQFVDELVPAILSILSKMIITYTDADKTVQNSLCGNISWIVTILGKLSDRFIATSSLILSSKQFMQFLMVEEVSLSLLAFSFLKVLLKGNTSIFYQVAESRCRAIVDELTFKLFGMADENIAKVSLSVLIFILEMHPLLLDLFLTKRYRGFKTYISKLQGKGFDGEVLKLISILESETKHLQTSHKEQQAAILIQSCYKGYRMREKLRRANIAISIFQCTYRRKTRRQNVIKSQNNIQKMKDEFQKAERRKIFFTSKAKQLKSIETIPAKTVDKFLENLDRNSAIKIQAAWRGHKTRKSLSGLKPGMKKVRAVIVIQRQVRRWLRQCRARREHGLIEILPSGLTDERKCELQKVIGNIRNRFPVSCKTDAELYELHERTYWELNKHMMGLHHMRRQDERRKGLIAQLTVLRDQMSQAPNLNHATPDHVDKLSSHSTPIIMAARAQHQDFLSERRDTWWKKYTSTDKNFASSEDNCEIQF